MRILLPSTVAVVALAAYVGTLCPSVPGGDSGEMMQLALELGVAHPPGYPTWTLLAHLFSYIPAGEPAWRVNLSSAACDAAAAGLICAAVELWCGSAWAGAAAGGAFAFAPLVWQYATQAEVFALNNLLNALLLLLLVRFDQRRSLGAGCAAAAGVGLALTNQHTIVFFCVPYAIWALFLGRKAHDPATTPAPNSRMRSLSLNNGVRQVLLRPVPLLALCASGLVGLSPYVYLYLRGGADASWGSWGNQVRERTSLPHAAQRILTGAPRTAPRSARWAAS